jgi:outer membrane lipoprotein SlyB
VTGGSAVGTIGGAALGGYLGHEAGTDYDKKHR